MKILIEELLFIAGFTRLTGTIDEAVFEKLQITGFDVRLFQNVCLLSSQEFQLGCFLVLCFWWLLWLFKTLKGLFSTVLIFCHTLWVYAFTERLHGLFKVFAEKVWGDDIGRLAWVPRSGSRKRCKYLPFVLIENFIFSRCELVDLMMISRPSWRWSESMNLLPDCFQVRNCWVDGVSGARGVA